MGKKLKSSSLDTRFGKRQEFHVFLLKKVQILSQKENTSLRLLMIETVKFTKGRKNTVVPLLCLFPVDAIYLPLFFVLPIFNPDVKRYFAH